MMSILSESEGDLLQIGNELTSMHQMGCIRFLKYVNLETLNETYWVIKSNNIVLFTFLVLITHVELLI